jgi:hypothetical protein
VAFINEYLKEVKNHFLENRRYGFFDASAHSYRQLGFERAFSTLGICLPLTANPIRNENDRHTSNAPRVEQTSRKIQRFRRKTITFYQRANRRFSSFIF